MSEILFIDILKYEKRIMILDFKFNMHFIKIQTYDNY